MIPAIETSYAGCRFRSRLEARWAVFFDHMGIGWQYEPQGYICAGRPYLPDFLLDCGTWIEVKGSELALDRSLMLRAAMNLPWPGVISGDACLMILGPIPRPPAFGDVGWLGFCHVPDNLQAYHYGFAHGSPGHLQGISNLTETSWTEPIISTELDSAATRAAYAAARSARFEHGQNG